MVRGAGLAALALALTVAATGAGARTPQVPRASACADVGVASGYDVFLAADYVAQNNQLQGIAAAGGRVQLRSFGIGSALTPDASRLALIAGGDLDVNNAQSSGSVRYGGTLTGAITVPAGGSVARGTPPFSFADETARLAALSLGWRDLPATGTATLSAWGELRLAGTDPALNVFALTTDELQSAKSIVFAVPPGAAALVNVSGQSYSTAAAGAYGAGSASVPALWNFADATSVQIGGLDWWGTVLAPAGSTTGSNGQIHGSVWAHGLEGSVTVAHAPFSGCLPPVSPPTPTPDTLRLAARCVNTVTDRLQMRARNTGDDALDVNWSDRLSAQTGSFVLPPKSDLYFEVEDGNQPHEIIAVSGGQQATAEGVSSPCRGTIHVGKSVSGDGMAPGGKWTIVVRGDSGVTERDDVAAGGTVTFQLPATYTPGAVPLGETPPGYRYVVSEPDGRGAVVSIDRPVVSLVDGAEKTAHVDNRYDAAPPTPEPPTPEPPTPEPPMPEPPTPIPPLVPVVPGQAGADLAIAERFSHTQVPQRGAFEATVTVRNLGPAQAVGVVTDELPQLDPRHPNRVVRIRVLSGGATCTDLRPIRCALGNLDPGAVVTLRALVRPLVTGELKSLVRVSSQTAEPNTTNNYASTGIVVTEPSTTLGVDVLAPASAYVGDPVRYRIRAHAGPGAGARAVRICHRPPAGLLVGSSPGAVRRGSELCRDVRRIPAGGTAGFTVTATASTPLGNRTVGLPARAAAPGQRTARDRAPLRVLARTYEGTG